MMVEGTGEGDEQAGQTAHQTVIAFKSKNHLKIIHTVARGVNINCNAGNLKTNQQGEFGTMKVWYIPEGIANIFLMNELEINILLPTTVGKGTMWCIPKMDQ